MDAVVPNVKGGVLIWTPSVSGELSFKDAYEVCHSRGHCYKWLACVWLLNVLYRFVITFFCCMCKHDEETVSHLFFSCPCATNVWHWLFEKFQMRYALTAEFIDFFKRVLHFLVSAQVKEIWPLSRVLGANAILGKVLNLLRFDGFLFWKGGSDATQYYIRLSI